MKDMKDRMEDFDREFQEHKERFAKLRSEMDAERANRPSYYELERECRWLRLERLALTVFLFLCIVLVYLLSQHPC